MYLTSGCLLCSRSTFDVLVASSLATRCSSKRSLRGCTSELLLICFAGGGDGARNASSSVGGDLALELPGVRLGGGGLGLLKICWSDEDEGVCLTGSRLLKRRPVPVEEVISPKLTLRCCLVLGSLGGFCTLILRSVFLVLYWLG